jgi:hypothetical protein
MAKGLTVNLRIGFGGVGRVDSASLRIGDRHIARGVRHGRGITALALGHVARGVHGLRVRTGR